MNSVLLLFSSIENRIIVIRHNLRKQCIKPIQYCYIQKKDVEDDGPYIVEGSKHSNGSEGTVKDGTINEYNYNKRHARAREIDEGNVVEKN